MSDDVKLGHDVDVPLFISVLTRCKCSVIHICLDMMQMFRYSYLSRHDINVPLFISVLTRCKCSVIHICLDMT